MDVNHPKNIDPRPKRRKDRDNPYDCILLGKHTVKRVLCFGGGQPASAVSVVLISMYSAILRNSSANLK